jgi:hypothetical protein
MSFSGEWAELLTWRVQVTIPNGKDQYGNRSYTDPVEIAVHVDQVSASPVTTSGKDGVRGQEGFDGVLYAGTDVELLPGSYVTFPWGLEVELTTVVAHYNENGQLHHYEATWEEN